MSNNELLNMKRLITLCVSLMIGTAMNAQVIYNSTGRKGDANYRNNTSVKGFDINKFFVGSGIDFGIVYKYLRVGVSPMAGYKFNDYFTAGVSARFMYESQRDVYALWNSTGGLDYKPFRSRIYGPGVWARLNFFQSYFIHTEFEYNKIDFIGYQQVSATAYEKIKDSYTVPSLMVGAGYTAYITDKVSFYGILLYDVLQSIPRNMRTVSGTGEPYSISPYADQLSYRIGIAVGL